MNGKPVNQRAIFWISVLALFTAAMANAVRAGAAGAMKAALLDPIDAQHSGEMIGQVLGNSFLGFALSLLVISPLLDRFGAKRVVLFAAACFILGPALVLAAAGAGGSTYVLLNCAMVIWGFGWGATEASINPVIATAHSASTTPGTRHRPTSACHGRSSDWKNSTERRPPTIRPAGHHACSALSLPVLSSG